MKRARTSVVVMLVLAFLAACGVEPAATDTTQPEITTTTTTPTAPDVTTTTIPDPTTSTIISDPLQEAVAAFDDWVGAVAAADSNRAWNLMASSSQRAIGSFELFDTWRSAMAEGWGSWVAVDNASHSLEPDEAGRTLLIVTGIVRPEGMEEEREVGVPVVEEDGRVVISPFEEFGNVAEGLDEEPGTEQPPVPADSGEGKRVVYSNSEQRVWLVEADGSVTDTYLVSGREGVPAAGEYEVFSKSEIAYAGYDDITMTHMVRFAHGTNLAIGFHAIPNDGRGRPLQSEEQLGEYRSAGCVRQSQGHAAALYEWAEVGTTVVVLQ